MWHIGSLNPQSAWPPDRNANTWIGHQPSWGSFCFPSMGVVVRAGKACKRATPEGSTIVLESILPMSSVRLLPVVIRLLCHSWGGFHFCRKQVVLLLWEANGSTWERVCGDSLLPWHMLNLVVPSHKSHAETQDKSTHLWELRWIQEFCKRFVISL